MNESTGPRASDEHQYAVLGRTQHFAGRMFRVVTDQVMMPGGQVADRDYLQHVGAVAVVPYDDLTGQVVLVRQYRHPVGTMLWELPAGLLDVAGEPPRQVAERELAEEADLVCQRLHLLLDLHPSPGCSDESIRVFLARDLVATPQPFARQDEEAGMVVARFPLQRAVEMVLHGQITNATACAGLLATAAARAQGWAHLQAADAPQRPLE